MTITALALLFSLTSTAAAETGRQFEAEVGFGQLDEDWLLTTRLGLLWFDEVAAVGCRDVEAERCVAPVRVALNLPIRFEVVDAEPRDDEIVRTEDWDDPGDFLRLVRFVQIGEKYQPLYARAGELGPVMLGHGTITNGYLNTITVGDFSPGIEAAVNTAYGGLQAFLDDYTRPAVLGLRGFVRPWGFGERGFLHRFALGVSAVSDFSAPIAVESGDPVRGQPVVSESTSFTVAGVDLELTPVDTDVVELLTYADVNFALGVGAHLGTTLRVAFHEDWAASLRVEGRLLGSQYIPDYFGPLYHLERYRLAGWGAPSPAPKARVAASREGTAYGGLAQLGVAWKDFVSLSLAASDHSGEGDTSAWLRLSVTPPGPFTIGVYWARLHTDPKDLLRLDGTLFAAESRFTVWGPIYLHGRYDRLFRLSRTGAHVPAVEWTAGVGAALPF